MRLERNRLAALIDKPFNKLGALSIKTKFILFFMFSSLIPIVVLGIFSYDSSVRALEKEYTGASAVSLNRVSSTIDIVIQQLNDFSEAIWRNELVQTAALKPTIDNFDRNAVRIELQYIGKFLNCPVKTLVILDNGNYFCSFPYNKQEMEEVIRRIKQDDWYGEINKYDNSTHFLGVKRDRYFGQEGFYHFYFNKNLYDRDKRYIGQILLDINAYTFDRLLNSLNAKETAEYYLLDGNLSLLALSNENRDDRVYSFTRLKDSITGTGTSFKTTVYGTRQLVTYSRLSYKNWILLGIVDERSIMKGATGIRLLTVFLVFTLLLFEIVIYFVVNRTITSPILRLSKEMKKVENGAFDIKLEPQSSDEVGILTHGFNHMILKIKKLIENIVYEQKQAKEYEFAMLQAQINPHFLYNSLNSISQLADLNHSNNISSAIHSLSSLLRYAISDRSDIIPLKKEIRYIESYIHLNNIRYNNRFELINNIPEDCLDAEIVKFSLQPLVENSILHGFKNKRRVGRITLDARDSGGNLVIMISDDGQGMDPMQIDEILYGDVKHGKQGFSHIGLMSVDRRIKLVYGNKYGIRIDSKVGEGTTISITLPRSGNKGELLQE